MLFRLPRGLVSVTIEETPLLRSSLDWQFSSTVSDVILQSLLCICMHLTHKYIQGLKIDLQLMDAHGSSERHCLQLLPQVLLDAGLSTSDAAFGVSGMKLHSVHFQHAKSCNILWQYIMAILPL